MLHESSIGKVVPEILSLFVESKRSHCCQQSPDISIVFIQNPDQQLKQILAQSQHSLSAKSITSAAALVRRPWS